MSIDLTAQLIPLYWGLLAVLVLSVAAIVAMVERHPDEHHGDVFLPERLFASEALALAAGIALLVVALSAIRW